MTAEAMTRRFEREHRLLALCADPEPDEQSAHEILGLAGESLDWAYVLGATRRLGALPLLHLALERSGAVLPQEVERLGRQARVANTMRMLVAERQLREIREAFEKASIPFLILKGLPLAHELYPEPGLRPVGDLDLLVRRRFRDTALAVLASLGYRLPAKALPLRFYRRHHFHVLLGRSRGESLPLELHWQPHSFFSLSHVPEEELWSSARALQVGGQAVQVPGREENYLLLVQHAQRHLMGGVGREAGEAIAGLLDPAVQGRLFWLSDLILLGRSTPLDGEKVSRLAAQWGLEGDLAGVRGILQRLRRPGEGEGGSDAARVESGRKGYAAARAISRRFPALSKPSRLLHFRPALIGEIFRVAFPGAPWIRWRYGLDNAPAARTLAMIFCHSAHVAARLIGLGGGALAGMAVNWIRRRNTHLGASFTPSGNCEIPIATATLCTKSD
jgi:hypothetical protein